MKWRQWNTCVCVCVFSLENVVVSNYNPVNLSADTSWSPSLGSHSSPSQLQESHKYLLGVLRFCLACGLKCDVVSELTLRLITERCKTVEWSFSARWTDWEKRFQSLLTPEEWVHTGLWMTVAKEEGQGEGPWDGHRPSPHMGYRKYRYMPKTEIYFYCYLIITKPSI